MIIIAFFINYIGCQKAARLRGRIRGVEDVIEQAERNGAYNCAPKQLAIAKSHLEFAKLELEEGYYSKALFHFKIAKPNAEYAYYHSPPEKCAPKKVLIARPAPPPECPDPDRDGICGDKDKCPNEPEDYDGFEDEDGCPEDQDIDGDGIMDSSDLCPTEPEDKDNYQDNDGCPELDNDLDGVVDKDDKCINEPEDPDGFQDEDGCPDNDNDNDGFTDLQDYCPNTPGVQQDEEPGCPRKYVGVVVRTDKIEINQQIHFEFDSDVIRPESYPILDTVAQVLKDYPNITIEIQGHTDSTGPADYNYWLSHDRAKAVMEYLIKKGIDPSRLTYQGYGETCPIASNRTPEGRAKNRRVEFIRTDVPVQRLCPIPEEPPMPKRYWRKHRKYKGKKYRKVRRRRRR